MKRLAPLLPAVFGCLASWFWTLACAPAQVLPSLTTNLPDQNQSLLQLAGQMAPGLLVVHFNFLMTSNPAQPAVIQAAQSYGSLPAFQVNNWFAASSAGSAWRGVVTNPTPCDDASYLEMMQQGIHPLGQTNSLRSQYIEVWATNATVFTNAIWQAHQELFAPR